MMVVAVVVVDDVMLLVAAAAVVLDFPFLFPFAVDDWMVPMVWAKMMHTTMTVAVKTIHNYWHHANKLHRDVLLHREMPLQRDYT